jgi:hypothetical protein
LKNALEGESSGRISHFFAIGFCKAEINFLKSLDTAKFPVRKSTGYHHEEVPWENFSFHSGSA